MQRYDEVDEINIGPNGVTVKETKLTPVQVKTKYKVTATGSCEGLTFKIHRYNNKFYCFLSKDISTKVNDVKKEIASRATYFKYYKADKCLVIQLKSGEGIKTLEDCFTKTICH